MQRNYWPSDAPGSSLRWRQSVRLPLRAYVTLRRASRDKFVVQVDDISRHGCRVTFVDQPLLDERVSVKFDGLELLPAMVCWVREHQAGLEFERPVHEAVFDHLARRLNAGPAELSAR